MAAAGLAWFLYVYPGQVEFLNRQDSLFDPGAAIWVLKECGIVVLVAAIGAHVEKFRGRWPSNVAMAVLAYVAVRALSGGTSLAHPGFLSSWWLYPMSHWLWNADFLLPGIFVQAWLLRPFCPVFVCDTGKICRRAAVILWRAAVILCVLPFLLWDWLSGSVGSASAGLICALALVLVMVVARRQRFVLFALASCVGFLTVSAFAQHGPPPRVLDTFDSSAPDIDFSIAPPARDDTSGLSMTVNVDPGVPTLFGCPTQVDVLLSLVVERPSKPKDMPQYNKLLADLKRSPYTLDVSGVTRITDPDLADSADNGSSRVIYASQSRDGDSAHTEWRATGFNPTPSLSDLVGSSHPLGSWSFGLPLQSWRSMGTCYVTIPRVNQETSWAGTNYPTQPASATVSLRPGTTSVDLTNTSPRPADQPVAGGTYNWTCFDHSHHGSSGVAPQCPAIAVMTVGWSASYPQVVLLVAGALIAIVAERWFRDIHSGKPEGKKTAGHDGDKDADPRPGDGHTSGTDVDAPDSPGT
jgi:hypothetical protein